MANLLDSIIKRGRAQTTVRALITDESPTPEGLDPVSQGYTSERLSQDVPKTPIFGAFGAFLTARKRNSKT